MRVLPMLGRMLVLVCVAGRGRTDSTPDAACGSDATASRRRSSHGNHARQRRPQGSGNVLTFGLACLVRWDSVPQGIVRGAYTWGVASYASLAIPVALLAAAIWLLVAKRRTKRANSKVL